MGSVKCMTRKCILSYMQICKIVNANMRKGEEVLIGIENMVKCLKMCYRGLKRCVLENCELADLQT